MPTPKELKGELEGKFIDVVRSPWHKKCYKVLGYDSDTDLYTCAPTKVEGPLEHIKLKAENITVYVDVIPVEESSEDETSESEDEDEDEDDDDEEEEEKVSTPFTAEGVRKMKREELKQLCQEHKLFTPDWPQRYATVPKMKEALMNKFGLQGSILSDRDLKLEVTNNAMAAFLKLANVLAVTSTIPGFDHKNRAHAERFMKEYRKQNGKGPTQSQKST